MKNKLSLTIAFWLLLLHVHAQSELSISIPHKLDIGKKCPDFTLYDIEYSDKKQVSLNDLKGQYIILDFFSRGCVSCFTSLPRVNALQKEFKERVKIILVGYQDGLIREQFERS